MVFKATVVYPNQDDIKFDMDYYLKTHMPLVDEKWKQHGLKGWEIVKATHGLGDAKPAYAVQAQLIFDSAADFQKAMESEDAKPVFGDIPNFTNTQPTLIAGESVATG